MYDNLYKYEIILKDLLVGRTKFLGPFSVQIRNYNGYDFPSDLSNSCLLFFERMLDPSYIPGNDNDLESISYQSYFAVQFEEASLKRFDEVLEMFENVLNYISIQRKNLMENEKPAYDEVDNSNVAQPICDENKFPIPASQDTVNYYDTKQCDCVEYEMSGDCSCLD